MGSVSGNKYFSRLSVYSARQNMQPLGGGVGGLLHKDFKVTPEGNLDSKSKGLQKWLHIKGKL